MWILYRAKSNTLGNSPSKLYIEYLKDRQDYDFDGIVYHEDESYDRKYDVSTRRKTYLAYIIGKECVNHDDTSYDCISSTI